MLEQSQADDSLKRIHTAIENEAILNDAVVDIQQYDDTLVVFTSTETPVSFVRLVLRKVWTGPIEVYCATALLTGSDMSLS